MFVLKILKLFQNLIFPNVCAACNCHLVRNEHFLCTQCLLLLPFIYLLPKFDNELAQIFWGRVQIENITALFQFHKKSRVQTLMHKLKYRGEKEIGVELGKRFGYEIKNTSFSLIDIIVPVPLHPIRYLKRGYNQSEMIANGISEILQKPVDAESVIRRIHNESQTRKHRYERWKNVEGLFEVQVPKNIEGKHILLVDDIVTTGATLEACASELLKLKDVKVSIVVLAKA